MTDYKSLNTWRIAVKSLIPILLILAMSTLMLTGCNPGPKQTVEYAFDIGDHVETTLPGFRVAGRVINRSAFGGEHYRVKWINARLEVEYGEFARAELRPARETVIDINLPPPLPRVKTQ